MDMNDTKPVLAMKRHLQKYIRALLSDIKEIEAKETDGKKEIASLANLLEQRECVSSVDVTGMTLVSLFPDVQLRLLVKLSAEVEIKLDRLKNLIEPLKKHNNVAYAARSQALNLIRIHSNDLDACTLTTGQPTVPPLMAMLGWVDTVERQTRQIYHTRVYYLDNIVDREIVNFESLVTLWLEDVPALLDTVKDCEEQSRYFLEELY